MLVQDISSVQATASGTNLPGIGRNRTMLIRTTDAAWGLGAAPNRLNLSWANLGANGPAFVEPQSAALMLITTENKDVPRNANRFDIQSFYTGSGWFNWTSGGDAGGPDVGQLIYNTSFTDSQWPGEIAVAAYRRGQLTPFTTEDRKAMFKMLAYGRKEAGEELTTNIKIGYRPNLHIGHMVYADRAPDSLRFKHVAAHILAQTVVTRGLAVRLMQPMVGQGLTIDAEMQSACEMIFGVIVHGTDHKSRTSASNTALAYMAVACMHTKPEIRSKAVLALKDTLKWDLQDIGNNLTTWFKLFLNTIPAPPGGTQSPSFHVLQAGRTLEETFRVANETDPTTNDNGGLDEVKMGNIPVMYLGAFIPVENNRAVFRLGDDFTVGTYTQARSPDKWTDNGDADLAMNRDVNDRSFNNLFANVFPVKGPNDRIMKQDIIAVNQSAGTTDSLAVFVQIMCKRFFTSEQELYVENNPIDRRTDTNNGIIPADYAGVSRRALTSNDYATMYVGAQETLVRDQEKWEIVVVRPNIEHNMLAAVLGRGGSEDLGSTFWGQTELSCYVSLSLALSSWSFSPSLN